MATIAYLLDAPDKKRRPNRKTDGAKPHQQTIYRNNINTFQTQNQLLL
jgi:hypothetical protein